MDFCARQGLGWMLTCVLLVSSAASSHYKSRRLGMADEDYPYPYIEPEDSYYTSTSAHDLLEEEEERILSALARIDELEMEKSPKRNDRKHYRDATAKRSKSSPTRSQTRNSPVFNRLNPAAIDGGDKARSNSRDADENQEFSSRAQDSSSKPSKSFPNTSMGQSSSARNNLAQGPIHRTPNFGMPLSPQIRQMPQQPTATKQQSVSTPRQSPVTPTKKGAASTTTPWVRKYLSSRLKDVLLPVPTEYISDGFNLAQLPPIVERIGFQVMGNQAVDIAKRLVELSPRQPSYPIYRLALQLLLNEDESQESAILQHPLIPPHAIEQATEALYLMIHARFVASPRGLDALRRILLNSPVYGKCPNLQCQGAALLPYGSSNDFGASSQRSCQRYCPCCGNLWNCWESKTDGSAWGPSLCHLLLLAHGTELYSLAGRSQPSQGSSRPAAALSPLQNPPAVMGFQIHPAATWGRPLNESW